MTTVLAELARVVCPPEIETLGLVDDVVDHVQRSIAAMPPAVRAALVAGLTTYAAGGMLSRRDPAKRFASWWNSRRALRRELAHAVKGLLSLAYYEQPAVKRQLGYSPEAWIEKVQRRRLVTFRGDIAAQERRITAADPLEPALILGERGGLPERSPALRFERSAIRAGGYGGGTPPIRCRDDIARDTVVDCEVVIIGSGAGGATCAAELAEHGVDVVVLEEGRYHTTRDFTADASAMIRALYRDAGATMALGRPPVLYQEGVAVGGSTVINGGMSWRTPERILDRWHHGDRIDRIGAADMEPYFSRVERRIHVSAQDPESIGEDNAILSRGARAKGWKLVDNLRNQVHCPGSNNCAFGCPTGAKQSALVTYIPRALHFGARIYSDVRVDRVTRHGKRATGAIGHVVRADGTPGPRLEVRARLVIVAGGAIQTPALLARSGFRSPSGLLGRQLSMHPNVKVVALFDHPVRGWEGVHQAYQVREFQDEGLVFAAVNVPPGLVGLSAPSYGAELGELMGQYDHMVVAGMLCEDTSVGRVRTLPGGRAQAFYDLGDADADKLRRGTALLADLLFAAGARRILLPFGGCPDLLGPDDARRLLSSPIDKRRMEVLTVHMMGTARMGADRSRSVTDGFGHVWDADRLAVCDASLFPSPIGVNPMETIQALATRNMHHILSERRRYLT